MAYAREKCQERRAQLSHGNLTQQQWCCMSTSAALSAGPARGPGSAPAVALVEGDEVGAAHLPPPVQQVACFTSILHAADGRIPGTSGPALQSSQPACLSHLQTPCCICNCCNANVWTCVARYGDPKKMDAGSPDQAFATLFRDQCSVKFLEAHAAMLGRYAEVLSHQPHNFISSPSPSANPI